jgi:hypothetical protein
MKTLWIALALVLAAATPASAQDTTWELKVVVPKPKAPASAAPDGEKPKLMRKGAWAALTPYNRGFGLPTPADCQRIFAESPQAYITAAPQLGKFRHANAAVQKTALEATISIGEEFGKQGHIRLRRKANDANSGWRIDLFGDAVPLVDLIRH